MNPKHQQINELIAVWGEYWKASEKLEERLEDLQVEKIKDITNQRILQMKSKIRADRYDLEFNLNRIIEDERVNQ